MDDYGYFKHCEVLISITGIAVTEPMQVTFLQGRESLASLYNFYIGIQTKNDILKPDLVLSKFVVLTMRAMTAKQQYQNFKTGYIVAIEVQKNLSQHPTLFKFYYKLTLAPKLAFLQYHHDCRIFKGKNSVDIIKFILHEHGFLAPNDYTIDVTNNLAKNIWPVCIQYQESDWQFLQRLMATCGMFYFFKHSDSRQQLAIRDNNSAIEACKLSSPPYIAYEQDSLDAPLAGFYNVFLKTLLPAINTGCTSYINTDPSNYLYTINESQKANVAKHYLSSHPHFGKFVSDTHLVTRELNQNTADLLFTQTKVLAQQLCAQCNLPTIAVGYKFDTTNANFKNYLGTECADSYFITEISYDIKLTADGNNLLHNNHQGLNNLHNFNFKLTGLPANNAIPTVHAETIPPSPVIGVIHHAFVVNKEGSPQCDDNCAVADEYGMPYVGLHWDQTVRNQANPKNYIALNTIFPRPAGFFDIPHLGETVKVQFSNWCSLPYLLGSINDSKKYKFPIQEMTTQSKILSRPSINSLKTVNQILLEDKKNAQNFLLDAPSQFNIKAAKADDSPKFTLAVDHKGNVVIEATSIVLKATQNDITLHAAENITLQAGKAINCSAGTNVITKAQLNLEQQAGAALTTKADATMDIKASTITVDGGGLLTLKAGLIKEN